MPPANASAPAVLDLPGGSSRKLKISREDIDMELRDSEKLSSSCSASTKGSVSRTVSILLLLKRPFTAEIRGR